MQTYLECVPCFLRQALDASRMVTDDVEVHERVVRDTLGLVEKMPFDHSPPAMGQKIHQMLREASGNPDPYSEVKASSNSFALELYPSLKQRVNAAEDRFATAVLLAIAGNIIDFGCKTRIEDDEVHQAVESALAPGEVKSNNGQIDVLREAIERSESILYLADNAGEIVFDRLLLEEMPIDRTTMVVRGSPVINDATLEDAERAGLTSVIKVIDNGSDVPGTILETCSESFKEKFRQSDLIIAKGQGNYETLNSEAGNIFFLLKVKCPVIARDIGCEVGRALVCRNQLVDW